jgi:glucokinase
VHLGPSLIGINVGGTTTSVVVGGRDATIRARRSWPTRSELGPGHFVDTIVSAVGDLCDAPDAVGLSIGGPLNVRSGVLLDPPHLPGLAGFAVRDALAARFAVPVVMHHDAAACALAEWRWGTDAGAGGIAYLTCGTGFGCGLVMDGRVRYGSDGRSPEIGHVRYRDDGPGIFDKPGCYEGYGSAKGLALLAQWRDPVHFTGAAPERIAALAAAGDPVAREAVLMNERAVGSACAMLADLLALDVIVLGSLASYLGEPWIEAVRSAARREVLPLNETGCTLRGPSIDAIQDRGALAAAVEAHDLAARQP